MSFRTGTKADGLAPGNGKKGGTVAPPAIRLALLPNCPTPLLSKALQTSGGLRLQSLYTPASLAPVAYKRLRNPCNGRLTQFGIAGFLSRRSAKSLPSQKIPPQRR